MKMIGENPWEKPHGLMCHVLCFGTHPASKHTSQRLIKTFILYSRFDNVIFLPGQENLVSYHLLDWSLPYQADVHILGRFLKLGYSAEAAKVP